MNWWRAAESTRSYPRRSPTLSLPCPCSQRLPKHKLALCVQEPRCCISPGESDSTASNTEKTNTPADPPRRASGHAVSLCGCRFAAGTTSSQSYLVGLCREKMPLVHRVCTDPRAPPSACRKAADSWRRAPPPSLPYGLDTPRPSSRTNRTRLLGSHARRSRRRRFPRAAQTRRAARAARERSACCLAKQLRVKVRRGGPARSCRLRGRARSRARLQTRSRSRARLRRRTSSGGTARRTTGPLPTPAATAVAMAAATAALPRPPGTQLGRWHRRTSPRTFPYGGTRRSRSRSPRRVETRRRRARPPRRSSLRRRCLRRPAATGASTMARGGAWGRRALPRRRAQGRACSRRCRARARMPLALPACPRAWRRPPSSGAAMPPRRTRPYREGAAPTTRTAPAARAASSTCTCEAAKSASIGQCIRQLV